MPSTTAPVITREDGPTGGRYVARVEGVAAEAEIVYSHAGPKLISAEHTNVPDLFRGQGLGRLLAAFMVEDARTQGFKIIPGCSFVDAERKKHPDWADVFEA
ncbi:MAG TPA: GNAT family N-acetyltransferase [Hyphomicrobiaceae bacterium]|nr:GNAT family N-acetyltransferase [Hyphomicrobiaceae bacterium]